MPSSDNLPIKHCILPCGVKVLLSSVKTKSILVEILLLHWPPKSLVPLPFVNVNNVVLVVGPELLQIFNLLSGFVVPIPTLPLFIIVNTSPEPLLTFNISWDPADCVIVTAVAVLLFCISRLSVVNTSVSNVVLSPNIVKLDVIKSPFNSTSPVYNPKSTDITPLLSINVFVPFLTPPKVVSVAGFKFIIWFASIENSLLLK